MWNFLDSCKSYCLKLPQNLKFPSLCTMDQRSVQYFFNHFFKDQVYGSRDIVSHACIVNSMLDKPYKVFFSFRFALSKWEAVLSIARHFLTLLNGVAESPIFTSSLISFIFSLCLGIQKVFLIFFFLGFGSLS